MSEKATIVMRPSITDTFKAIRPGESATFSCRELGPIYSAFSAISRLNAAAKRKEYSVATDDNGAHYTVTRHP